MGLKGSQRADKIDSVYTPVNIVPVAVHNEPITRVSAFLKGVDNAIGEGGAPDIWLSLVEDTDFNDQAASTTTITMVTDQTGVIFPGMALKVVNNSITHYVRCTAITSILLTLEGATLSVVDGHQTGLFYGPNVPIGEGSQMVVSPTTDYENWDVQNVAAFQAIRMNISASPDLGKMISVKLFGAPSNDDIEGKDFSIFSSYAAPGEMSGTHSENDVTTYANQELSWDVVFFFELMSVLTGINPGDEIGLRVNHNGTSSTVAWMRLTWSWIPLQFMV